jgi:hypothetical protein
MSDCQHQLLGDIELVRCDRHSNEHAETWTWLAAEPDVKGVCPCEDGEKYVVVREHAPANWLDCADVLIADPQQSLRAARQATYPTRITVVAIPVEGRGIVFRTDANWTNSKMCGICVYPVLVTTGVREPRPGPAGRLPHGAPRFRRRDSERA